MKISYPPEKIVRDSGCKLVFLAGSIEMGKAENWQSYIIKELTPYPVSLLNPRRNDWDSTWEQKIENPYFSEQVNWELDGLDQADLIVMYLDPATYSPVSLLELGLYARSGKLIVCCPEGFWRKGNVDIVCKRLGVTQVDTLEILGQKIKQFCVDKE